MTQAAKKPILAEYLDVLIAKEPESLNAFFQSEHQTLLSMCEKSLLKNAPEKLDWEASDLLSELYLRILADNTFRPKSDVVITLRTLLKRTILDRAVRAQLL